MGSPRKWAACGGFFDVPAAQKRQAELDALMSAESFWNNREQAQKFIDEAATLRKKVDPLIAAENQLADIKKLVELSEGEPESAQLKLQQELQAELTKFKSDLDAFELRSLLSGPHDKRNCILSINSGAGGTEACDWANML